MGNICRDLMANLPYNNIFQKVLTFFGYAHFGQFRTCVRKKKKDHSTSIILYKWITHRPSGMIIQILASKIIYYLNSEFWKVGKLLKYNILKYLDFEYLLDSPIMGVKTFFK